MKNPIKFAVIAALLALAVVAPIASAVANGATSKPARFHDAAPAVIELPAVTITASAPSVVRTIPEIQVVGRRQAPAARRTASAAKWARCAARDLEQGGTFRADGTSSLSGSVIVCGS